MSTEGLSKLAKEISLKDPLSGETVRAFSLGSRDGLELVTIPDRALDIYRLCYQGITISHTDCSAGISSKNFRENGTEGFLRNFFVGFLTTCGLCNTGRPCQEEGRSYGLHGCISNTPCTDVTLREEDGIVRINGTADEFHDKNIHMRLSRTITLDTAEHQLSIQDAVQNLSGSPQPYMMMYHINFGAPFLSKDLIVDADFSYIENRDTGCQEEKEQLLRMGDRGSASSETVYYTRADMGRGITLYDPKERIQALLCARGEGLEWMGVWKSFSHNPYAVGIEPCICPGLGRVNARGRGLLVMLPPNETRKNTVSIRLQRR